MEKRYQVFVSSTFQDLQEERQEVMQALLELDCIPAGMELFPAANQDQWTLIKKVIDDCDYYIVISAGRYGSVGPEGIGYTEMEYRYALEKGKPIIGFLFKDIGGLPANRCESTDGGKAKLASFRTLMQAKLVRYWDSAAELGSQVSRSLVKLIRTEPAIGWIKADSLPSTDVTRELLALRKRVEELEEDLQRARLEPPAGSEALAQAEDGFTIEACFPALLQNQRERKDVTYFFGTTWNAIFAGIAPVMIDEVADAGLRSALVDFVIEIAEEPLLADDNIKSWASEKYSWKISDSDFQTIKVQLRALGLMTQSTKPRSLRNAGTYWTLTPLGDETMTRLRAVKKSDVNAPEDSAG